MTRTEHPLTTKLREAMEGGDPAKISRAVAAVNRELLHPDLWGVSRASQELGIKHPNLYKLDGLPKPAGTYDRGMLWHAYAIKNLARERRKKKPDA